MKNEWKVIFHFFKPQKSEDDFDIFLSKNKRKKCYEETETL